MRRVSTTNTPKCSTRLTHDSESPGGRQAARRLALIFPSNALRYCPWIPDGTDEFSEFGDVTQIYNRNIDINDEMAWRPPHIVFALIDDLGWNDLGFSSTWLSWATPTIDRLAREGLVLDSHCALGLCPLLSSQPPLTVPSLRRDVEMRAVSSEPTHWALHDSYGVLDWRQLAVVIDERVDSSSRAQNGGIRHRYGRQGGSAVVSRASEQGIRVFERTPCSQRRLPEQWHLGFGANASLPTRRGFDSFYGFFGRSGTDVSA